MLPPPITMASSTWSRTTWAMSSTMPSIVVRLMPNDCSPISASPESFRSTRRYRRSLFIASPFGAAGGQRRRCSDFGREIVLSLLDALAHHEQRKRVDRSAPLLQQLLDRQLVVL